MKPHQWRAHPRQRAILRYPGPLQIYDGTPRKKTAPMTPDEYQEAAMKTTVPMGSDDQLALAALGIAGEGGEIADHIKKHLFHGHALDLPHLSKEIGDALWYLTYLADALGLHLSDIMAENIKKLEKRYPNGFSHEASQNREEYAEREGGGQ